MNNKHNPPPKKHLKINAITAWAMSYSCEQSSVKGTSPLVNFYPYTTSPNIAI